MSILRLITSVAVSLVLVSNVVAVPSQNEVTTRALSFNPVGVELTPLKDFIVPSKRMTNAQRLARGLAPNPPVRRAPGQLRARQSATPTSESVSSTSTPTSSDIPTSSAPASDSASSAPVSSDPASSTASSTSSTAPAAPSCSTYNGYLKARYSSSTGQYTDGYVSKVLNSYGEWGFTYSTSSALAVTFDQCSDDTTTPLTLLSTNADTNYPYIAAITGFANTVPIDTLTTGSRNYAYIGGTGSDIPYGVDPQPQTNSFSTASGTTNDVETANWIVDVSSGAITAQWYNTDGSAPATTLAYVPSAGAFALVGDLNVFADNFGAAYTATFTFVTSLPTAV